MDSIRTILVAVDLDSPSQAALDAALPLAKALNARIVLLHVVPFSLTEVPQDLFYKSGSPATRERSQWAVALAKIADERKDAGVPIHTELREGIAWDTIIGCARDFPADLIVIGTHGRTGLPRGLLGSVAERVVRTSPVPVMTVRAHVTTDERAQRAPGVE